MGVKGMYKILIVEDEEMIRKGLHYTYDWLAMDCIVVGEGKIYNIASDVGFSNYRYFISVFKKYTNRTPSEFLEYFGKY